MIYVIIITLILVVILTLLILYGIGLMRTEFDENIERLTKVFECLDLISKGIANEGELADEKFNTILKQIVYSIDKTYDFKNQILDLIKESIRYISSCQDAVQSSGEGLGRYTKMQKDQYNSLGSLIRTSTMGEGITRITEATRMLNTVNQESLLKLSEITKEGYDKIAGNVSRMNDLVELITKIKCEPDNRGEREESEPKVCDVSKQSCDFRKRDNTCGRHVCLYNGTDQ